VVVRLLPGGLALAVPVGAFHSVGEHIGECRSDLGITSSGGRFAGGRTHVCEEGGGEERKRRGQKSHNRI